jgi:hypothetical protein
METQSQQPLGHDDDEDEDAPWCNLSLPFNPSAPHQCMHNHEGLPWIMVVPNKERR